MNKTFNIEGMSCAACSSAIERILNKVEAVDSVSVNLTTKKMVIEYNSDQLSVKDIEEKVEKAGFSANEHIESKRVVLPIDGMT